MENLSKLAKSLIYVGGTFIVLLLLAGIFRITCVDFIDNYELGYKFDTRTGKTEIIKEKGYIVTPPFLVKVHTIDLRPVQVCINANSRVLNCKLVKFNPKGFDLFISWHGRDDYEISTSVGGTQSSGNLAEILKSYAYDGSKDLEKEYPFIEIMKDLNPGVSNEDSTKVSQTIVPAIADTSKTSK
jgi:hypothetical protein